MGGIWAQIGPEISPGGEKQIPDRRASCPGRKIRAGESGVSRVFKLGHHQDCTNALLLVPTGGVEVSDAQGFQRNNFYAMVELLAAQCSLSCKRLSFSGMPARSARARLAASIQNRIAFMNCMRCDLILALPMPQNAALFFYRTGPDAQLRACRRQDFGCTSSLTRTCSQPACRSV